MNEQVKSTTDDELVQAAKMGSSAAFERLVERYFRIVYAIAYAHLGQRETAEDLAQEVFLRVFLSLGKLRNPKLFGPWVSRIARNAALNAVDIRWRKSRLVAMVPLDEEEESKLVDKREKGARERMEQEETNATVCAAILSLPIDQREIVMMRYIEGVSTEEIAERTGMHSRTVRRQLAQAVTRLKLSVEALLSDVAPSIRAHKSAATRTLAILGATTAMSTSAKSAMASVAGSMAEECLSSFAANASTSLFTKALGLLKTIPVIGGLVTETAIGGFIMSMKVKIIALCMVAFLFGAGAYFHQSQLKAQAATQDSSPTLPSAGSQGMEENEKKEVRKVCEAFILACSENNAAKAAELGDFELYNQRDGIDEKTYRETITQSLFRPFDGSPNAPNFLTVLSTARIQSIRKVPNEEAMNSVKDEKMKLLLSKGVMEVNATMAIPKMPGLSCKMSFRNASQGWRNISIEYSLSK